jgi:hypothetical protein
MAPQVINRLPIISNLLKWFKGDEIVVDNALFKLHHQASTFVIMFGLLFIFLENHLDGRAIICQGGDQYARSYCWIHGTAYIRPHLQGKATGCFVDQSKIESPEDAPVTAYYLWLPFLLTFCFGFAKMPRSLWRNFLEGNMLRNIIQDRDPTTITTNFFDFRPRFSRYHMYFGFCEFLNLISVLFSVVITDALLLNKFWGYGQEVLNYMWSVKHVGPDGKFLTHDPMCELFPTEVACYIRIGATTGSIDRSNYLCILSNNLFNQKYFLVLWLWWLALAVFSVLGLIYRTARICVPDLSRSILMRRVKAWRLDNLDLSGADCFVLDMLSANVPHHVMDKVLIEIAKRTTLKGDFDSTDNDNHNQTLPLKSTTAI